LPPPYTPHWLPEGDAFDKAQSLAPEGGAGTLVWHHRPGQDRAGRFDFAVVLEPEQALEDARKAVIVGMVALADALATHCPPERDIRFGWPTELVLDAGRLGGMRLAAAPGTQEGEAPEWMVLGVELISDRDHVPDAGQLPESISLKEEDFADPAAIIESFAAHLMLNFDRWTHAGFDTVAARYAGRLRGGGALGPAGELLREGRVIPLAEALAQADWRDGQGPRL
jgi:biotin-(acetyl-CoA carboxylase) ligase